jgi:hypothetical protein
MNICLFTQTHSQKEKHNIYQHITFSFTIHHKNTMPRSMIHSYIYFDTYWTPETGLVEHVFKETTANMDDDEFINSCKEQLKLYEPIKELMNCILLDSTLFFHEISSIGQDWCNANWNTYIQQQTKVRKVATVYSDSVFVQVTIEAMSDSFRNTCYQMEHFSCIQHANEWLAKSSNKAEL